MLGSFGLVGSKGDILIYRGYKENSSRSELQVFADRVIVTTQAEQAPVVTIGDTHFAHVTDGDVTVVATTKDNSNAALIFKFLYRFIELLKSYFKKVFNEAEVRKNFGIIYELLDEVIDYGYVQVIEHDILRKYITQGGFQPSDMNDEENLKKITIAATGATSWRPEGIKYKNNEIFIDVIESVNALFSSKGALLRSDVMGQVKIRCLLSGMPECKFGINDKLVATSPAAPTVTDTIALDDIRFHQCVRLSKFDAERAVTFTPPDGAFELMSYRATENVSCPFKLVPIIQERGKTKLDVNIKLRALFEADIHATDIVVTIPVPKHSAVASMRTVTMGKAKLEAEKSVISWKIPKIWGEQEASLTAEVELAQSLNDKAWSRPPVSLDFQVSMYTASGFRVRFLRVNEKSNYKPVKWIRYVTQAGSFQHRI